MKDASLATDRKNWTDAEADPKGSAAVAKVVSSEEWTFFESHYYDACCDCGLAHRVDVRATHDGYEVRNRRMDEYTAELRAQRDFPLAPRSAPEPSAEHWRCFHCKEVFTDDTAAAEHFGKNEFRLPACKVDITEYRRMEEAYMRSVEEDSDLHRQIARLRSEHQLEKQRAEEAGYARGLKDAGYSGEPRGQLAKIQPCGCVVCTCENEDQCQGCGAKHCGSHPVGQIPSPVYAVEPGAEHGWICVTDRLPTEDELKAGVLFGIHWPEGRIEMVTWDMEYQHDYDLMCRHFEVFQPDRSSGTGYWRTAASVAPPRSSTTKGAEHE